MNDQPDNDIAAFDEASVAELHKQVDTIITLSLKDSAPQAMKDSTAVRAYLDACARVINEDDNRRQIWEKYWEIASKFAYSESSDIPISR